MPKCFIYSVRGYRDGSYWNNDGDQANVMKTRSGRTISTVPTVKTAAQVPKMSECPSPQADDWFKSMNKKVVRYRDISYLSIITRCRLEAARVPVHLLGNARDSVECMEDTPFSYDKSRWTYEQPVLLDLERVKVSDDKEVKVTVNEHLTTYPKPLQEAASDSPTQQTNCAMEESPLNTTKKTNVSNSEDNLTDNTQSHNKASKDEEASDEMPCLSDSLPTSGCTSTTSMSDWLYYSEASDDSPVYLYDDDFDDNDDIQATNVQPQKFETERKTSTAKSFKLKIRLREKSSKKGQVNDGNQLKTQKRALASTSIDNESSTSGQASCSTHSNLQVMSQVPIHATMTSDQLPIMTSLIRQQQLQPRIPIMFSTAHPTVPVRFPQIPPCYVNVNSIVMPAFTSVHLVPHNRYAFNTILAKPNFPVTNNTVTAANFGANQTNADHVADNAAIQTVNASSSQTTANFGVNQTSINSATNCVGETQLGNVQSRPNGLNQTSHNQMVCPSSPCSSQASMDSVSSCEDTEDAIQQFEREVHIVTKDILGRQTHQCKACNRVFSVLTAFKSHVRSHVRQRNKCPICGKVFSRSWLLKGHLRIHSGERPYCCSHPGCDRAFADKSNLRSHRMTHSAPTALHQCPKCHRSFAQKRYLHKHMHEVCRG